MGICLLLKIVVTVSHSWINDRSIHTGSVMPPNLFLQTKFVSITVGQVGPDYILHKLEHMGAAPVPHLVHY